MNNDILRRLKAVNIGLNDVYVRDNAHEDILTYPKLITLTTTLKCNYRCWMCYQTSFAEDMDWRIVERIEHVLPSVNTVQLFGGEPLVYSRLEELVGIVSGHGCEIELITNGSLLDAKRRELLLSHNVPLVKVSLEAATQETYESIRGGDLEKVLGNIEKLVAEGKGRPSAPKVQVNFVAMRRNIEELAPLARRLAEIGVSNLLVLFMNCGGREDLARESLYFNQDLADRCLAETLQVGREKGIEIVTPGFFSDAYEAETVEVDRTCHSPWKNCIIAMDGEVSFCCGGAGPIGNVLETDFDTLWHDAKIAGFRKTVNTPSQPPCCQTCRVKGRNMRDPSFHIRDAALLQRLIAEFGGPEQGA